MPVSIDHLALPAADAEASARWFAEILGLAAALPDGPDEDMFNVRLNDSSSVLFVSEPAGRGHDDRLLSQVRHRNLGRVELTRD